MALSYSSGYYALNLDGVPCGTLQSVEGGNYSAEKTEFGGGWSYLPMKNITLVKVGDFKTKFAGVLAAPVIAWIKDTLAMSHSRKNGAVQFADYNLDVQYEREFNDALIAEIGFPAVDGSSKDTALMSLSFTPEKCRTAKKGGKLDGTLAANQKMLTSANFRFEVDGLAEGCKRVAKVDGFTVKQSSMRDEIGDAREYALCGGKLTIPDVSFELSEADAAPWYDWHEQFVINGKCHQEDEKSGVLTYLSHGRDKELMTLQFYSLGIFDISAPAVTRGDEKVRRIKVSLYCERVDMDVKA